MQLIFWLLLIIIFYVYLGYPLSLLCISRMRRIRVDIDTKYTPKISLIIAAYNEEAVIEVKIRNSLALDYPKEKLQIIVASDASIDKTNEIVKSYSQKGIKLYEQEERRGKSAALNYVVSNIAKGDIVVFTDATTFLKEDAIKNIARNFSDENVGAVCGKISFSNTYDSPISQNEGLYWRYEEFLRRKESQIGVLPFVSGAFYGIRRHLYTQVKAGLPDDSVSPLGVYKKGYRVVFEAETVAYERLSSTIKGEFRIKARGVVRELGSIWEFRRLLNPFKYPLLSLVILSHRILRWSVPFLLLAIFILNLLLLGKPIFWVTFWMQVAFYALVILGFMLRRINKFRSYAQGRDKWNLLSLLFYYCLVNLAAMWGVIQFLTGVKKPIWKSER